MILIFWLCWLLPISLSGFLVFGIHYTENYAFIGLGACGSIAAMVTYFIGNRHRADDWYEESDISEGERLYVIWKNPHGNSCHTIVRDGNGCLKNFRLPERLFSRIQVDQEMVMREVQSMTTLEVIHREYIFGPDHEVVRIA